MKFQVTGYSKNNGAKVHMDVDASSKADAERRALQSNLEVVRIEQVSEVDPRNATLPNRPPFSNPLAGHGASAQAARSRERSRPGNSTGLLRTVVTILLLLGIAGGVYMYWDKIKQFIPGLH